VLVIKNNNEIFRYDLNDTPGVFSRHLITDYRISIKEDESIGGKVLVDGSFTHNVLLFSEADGEYHTIIQQNVPLSFSIYLGEVIPNDLRDDILKKLESKIYGSITKYMN